MATKKNERRRRDAGRRRGHAGGDVEHADSDERHAFIAEYTAGGAAFGVTWEEWAESERQAADLASLERSLLPEDLRGRCEPPDWPAVRGAREGEGQPGWWCGRPVVVTGACGFIGAALSEALLARGARVFGIDRSWSPEDPLRRERAARLTRWSRFAPIWADLTKPGRLRSVFERLSGAVVFHLAARPGVRDPDVEGIGADNVAGTDNLLRVLRAVRPAQVVFASSSSVYGEGTALPFAEDGLRGVAPSYYARSKVLGEVAMRRFHLATGTPTTVARLFNVYGPRGRPDTVPSLFARRLVARLPITLAAAGAVERDFTYIGDVVAALVCLAEAAAVDGGMATVNVGTGVRASIRDVLLILAQHLGVEATALDGPAHSLDAPATQADVTRLAARVGWQPETSIEQGLARLVEWLIGDG